MESIRTWIFQRTFRHVWAQGLSNVIRACFFFPYISLFCFFSVLSVLKHAFLSVQDDCTTLSFECSSEIYKGKKTSNKQRRHLKYIISQSYLKRVSTKPQNFNRKKNGKGYNPTVASTIINIDGSKHWSCSIPLKNKEIQNEIMMKHHSICTGVAKIKM